MNVGCSDWGEGGIQVNLQQGSSCDTIVRRHPIGPIYIKCQIHLRDSEIVR